MLKTPFTFALVFTITIGFITGCNVDEEDSALDGEIEEEFDADMDDTGVVVPSDPDGSMMPIMDECENDTECSLESQTCLIPEGSMDGACGECLTTPFVRRSTLLQCGWPMHS